MYASIHATSKTTPPSPPSPPLFVDRGRSNGRLADQKSVRTNRDRLELRRAQYFVLGEEIASEIGGEFIHCLRRTRFVRRFFPNGSQNRRRRCFKTCLFIGLKLISTNFSRDLGVKVYACVG